MANDSSRLAGQFGSSSRQSRSPHAPVGASMPYRLFLASIPGLVTFLAIYLSRTFNGQQFNIWYLTGPNLWTLDPQVLQDSPLSALLGMHSQPPLLNAIYAVIWLSGENAALVAQVIWCLIFLLTIVSVVLILQLQEMPIFLSAVSGAILALLPGTGTYVFSSYNTSLVMLLTATTLVGVALLDREPLSALIITSASMTALFLLRSPFMSIVVIAWIISVTVIALRRCNRKQVFQLLVAALAFSSFVALVQAHYLIRFDQLPLSSFSSMNLSRVIEAGGVKDSTIAEIRQENPCFEDLTSFRDLGIKPSTCEEELSRRPFMTTVSSTTANSMNSREALVDSQIQNRLNFEVLRRDPLVLARAVLGTPETEGSLKIYLGSRVTWGSIPTMLFHALLPLTFCISLVLVLVVSLIRRHNPFRSLTLCYALVLSTFMTTYALIGEYGENDRIRAESHVALFVTICLLLWGMTRTPSASVSCAPYDSAVSSPTKN